MLIGELLDVVTVWKRSQRPSRLPLSPAVDLRGGVMRRVLSGRCGLLASLGSPPSPGIWCGHDCTRPWSRSGKAPSSITLASRAGLAQRSLFLRIGRRCLIQCNCRLELPPAFDSPWLCSSITSSFSSMTCKRAKRSADLSALSRPTSNACRQGTANVCYCFENAFLELLFLTDPSEASSSAIARTGLLQRAAWRELGTCPLGIAWRLDRHEVKPSFPTWPFRPPYLPEAMHIPVAVESDNLATPLLFQSPGTEPPAEWPFDRRGTLQKAAGLRRIDSVLLTSPRGFSPGPVFLSVLQATGCSIETGYRSRLGFVPSPPTRRWR